VPLAARDLDACAAIMAESDPWTRYHIEYASALVQWSDALRTGARVYVARIDDSTVGFAWYIARAGFGLSGYLKLIGVSASARGLGVGSALLARVERVTLADRQDDLFLLVSDYNTAAQRFYQHHGYQQVGALPDYVVAGITELIYRKHLVHPEHR
jgi:ribosomal protein S18 acetylase RimI-like enzyme